MVYNGTVVSTPRWDTSNNESQNNSDRCKIKLQQTLQSRILHICADT